MDSTSTLTPQDDATPPSVPFPDPTTSTTATAPVTAASACSNCGAALAADQRYCLVCGERNGDPRLPVMGGRDTLSSPATPAAVTTTTTRGPRGGGSTNTALIAGVGTLLVALGVGVVIGRSSDNNNATARTPQVITVGAPAAAAAGAAVAGASGTTPGDTAGAAGTTAGGGSDARTKDNKRSGDRARAKADATRAAAPGNGKVAARRGTVVRLGQRGTGKGYKNGRFTGDFFGG